MEDSQQIFELSTIVQSGLLLINDSPVSSDGIDVLVRTICENLTKIPNSDQSNDSIKHLEVNKSLEKLGPQRIFQLYTSLSSLILTAASENVSSNQLETKLKSFKWSQEQITRLLKTYSANQSKIRSVLKLFGAKPSKLVDVNWRLDYQLETNIRGPVHELVYIIDLILEDNNGIREPLTFTASHAELEDLVNTLKDACQCVKRVALL